MRLIEIGMNVVAFLLVEYVFTMVVKPKYWSRFVGFAYAGRLWLLAGWFLDVCFVDQCCVCSLYWLSVALSASLMFLVLWEM